MKTNMKIIIGILIAITLIVGATALLIRANRIQIELNQRHDCAIGMRNETGLTLEQAWDNCGQI